MGISRGLVGGRDPPHLGGVVAGPGESGGQAGELCGDGKKIPAWGDLGERDDGDQRHGDSRVCHLPLAAFHGPGGGSFLPGDGGGGGRQGDA